jgi:hypothetical protein
MIIQDEFINLLNIPSFKITAFAEKIIIPAYVNRGL